MEYGNGVNEKEKSGKEENGKQISENRKLQNRKWKNRTGKWENRNRVRRNEGEGVMDDVKKEKRKRMGKSKRRKKMGSWATLNYRFCKIINGRRGGGVRR